MAKTYNTIGTFTSGQILTATQMNEIGTNTNNYRVPPMCKLRLNATAAIANNTDSVCPFDTSDFDTDSMGTTGAAAKITAKTAGIYLVSMSVIFANNATGNRVAVVRKNASGAASTVTGTAANANHGTLGGLLFIPLVSSVLISLAVNDTVDCQVFQNSGGNLNVGAGSPQETFLSAVWVGQSS